MCGRLLDQLVAEAGAMGGHSAQFVPTSLWTRDSANPCLIRMRLIWGVYDVRGLFS